MLRGRAQREVYRIRGRSTMCRILRRSVALPRAAASMPIADTLPKAPFGRRVVVAGALPADKFMAISPFV